MIIELIKRIYKKIGPPYVIQWNFKKPTKNGMAIWPFIFIRDPANKRVMAHELIHHAQQVRNLHVFYYLRWWYYNFRYGYANNPFEIEAWEHEYDWMKK